MFSKIKEPVSGFTHLFGALLSIGGLSTLVTFAALHATAWHVVSFSIYGATMILLYTSSTLYHMLPLSEKGTRIFKRLDHIMIFMLIAGTYTPFCLVPLRGGWGWSIFGVVWGMAIIGLFMKLFWINAPRWASTSIYLAMGWVCIIAIYPLIKSIPLGCLFWMVLGGVFYSVGAVIYGLKRPNPWPNIFGFHEIWHIFVLAGSFSHFWAILRYVLYIRS